MYPGVQLDKHPSQVSYLDFEGDSTAPRGSSEIKVKLIVSHNVNLVVQRIKCGLLPLVLWCLTLAVVVGEAEEAWQRSPGEVRREGEWPHILPEVPWNFQSPGRTW